MHALPDMTAATLVDLYRRRELSPVEVMRATLDAATRCDRELNTFQLIDGDAALRAAAESLARWLRGEPLGPLDGVPIPIKDLVDVRGWPTRHGSLSTEPDAVADQDAPCVARLREAGAVLFGKTNTPEFGWKGLTDSPLAGATRNPWNTALSPGGSSGGAAACAAYGVCALAHGNDGGGSVRIPASYCGLYGIKPTFGTVPDYPRVGAYDTLAREGPLCRSVYDAALFLNAVTRPDGRDWYAPPYRDVDYTDALRGDIAGVRIGLSVTLGGVSPQPFIADAVRAAGRYFESLGAYVDEVDQVFAPLRPRFERYWLGGLHQRVAAVEDTKRDRLDPDLLRVAAAGRDVTLGEFSDGVTERGALAAQMSEWHRYYDLLLCPTMPTDPPPVETPYHTPDFDRWGHATPYTVAFNLTGQPAASIPCGISPDGMPIGLQIVGDRFEDALVLRASRAFEQEHPVHRAPGRRSGQGT